MKIVFTKHALEKLSKPDAKILKITKAKIRSVLLKPKTINKEIYPHRAVGMLNQELSLCVIFTVEMGMYKVITFYPAERGRYESKVL